MPASMSNEGKSLLISLLNRNPNKRLGAGPTDAEEIKKHPFFEHVDWDAVYRRKVHVPKPFIRDIRPQDFSQSVFVDTPAENENIIPGWSFANSKSILETNS